MESKVTPVLVLVIITFVFAATSLFLRLYSRYLTKAYFWWDDYFAIGCFLVDIGWVIIVPIWVGKGLGIHIQDVTWLSQADVLYWSKLLLYIAELYYAYALFFGKMSILSLYWRLFSVTNIKLPIRILMGCSIIWITIRTFLGIFHCIPVQAFWLDIPGSYCAINDKLFFFGSTLVHVIIDLAILALPVIQVRRLHLPKLQKVGITAMFMFGIFICIAGIAIVVTSVNFNATSIDLTWNISDIVLWATVEVNLVTVSACLPTARPAFSYFFGRFLPSSTLGSRSKTYGTDDQYGRHKKSRSIKLATMPRSTTVDEGSSTYQLAVSIHGDSHSEFEAHALDRNKGTRTIITGRRDDSSSDEDVRPIVPTAGGITVRSETMVQVFHHRDTLHRDGDPDGVGMTTLDERSLP
ncbi:hypothetical protein BJ170DRAFT_203648 [Xylariales sp. AK1849]|nr:hypothetical protein BJ170DRAFT_203648 [Xylariales sp. AK1849]